MSDYPQIPLNTRGIRPLDPTYILMKVGKNRDEALCDGIRVFARCNDYNLATDLVKSFNSGHYPEVCRWMQQNKDKLTGDGISLWMGMIDNIKGYITSLNPAFQNNANPNGGKSVPKAYQGGHLDPNVNQARVLKRKSKTPVQMWKVKLYNPSMGGAKTLLWTDHEQLADDLVRELNHKTFQATWDAMDWIIKNIPLVGFSQAGTYLFAAFHEYMDILEHEISNAKGRAASAPIFNAQTVTVVEADDNLDAMTHTDVDTFGIGQPNRKSTKEWEPDTPDPDVDLMKSIRDACTR